jgi:hypothetical protein
LNLRRLSPIEHLLAHYGLFEVSAKPGQGQERKHYLLYVVLSNAGSRTASRLTAIVHITLLLFSYKAVATTPALKQAPKQEIMLESYRLMFGPENPLNLVEERGWDQWLVYTGEGIACPLDPDDAHVEGVV